MRKRNTRNEKFILTYIYFKHIHFRNHVEKKMSSQNIDSIGKTVSTGIIVAVVLSSIFGLALCIGAIVVIVCIIKRCNRPRYPINQGMVLQPSYPYPHSMETQYPYNTTSVANYPPAYQSVPPPYNAPASDYTKAPYT
jgi:hypothetical protein